jgi:hypothetical protein
MADVNGVDAPRPRVEQRLSESSGGGTEIESDLAAWIDPEHAKRIRQLRRAPKSLRATQDDRVARGNERRRIGTGKAVDEYITGGDTSVWIFQTGKAARELGRERAQPRARAAHEEPPLEWRTVGPPPLEALEAYERLSTPR